MLLPSSIHSPSIPQDLERDVVINCSKFFVRGVVGISSNTSADGDWGSQVKVSRSYIHIRGRWVTGAPRSR